MKKVIFSALALSMFVMFSCQKEEVKPSINNKTIEETISLDKEKDENQALTSNEEDLINNIDIKTKSYLKENNIVLTNQQMKMPPWVKTAVADVKGAIEGAAVGAEGGDLLGLQDGVGLIGGAVIGGGAASAEAGMSTESIPNPNPNGGSGIIYNESNPYEGVGKAHYSLLDEVYNNTNSWFNDGGIDYDLYITEALNLLKIENLNCDTGKDCIFNQNFVVSILNDVSTYNGSDPNFPFSLNSNSLTYHDKIILKHYLKVMLWLQSYNSTYFVNFSIMIEGLVMNSNISNRDKMILLSTMSTGRIGFQYWKI